MFEKGSLVLTLILIGGTIAIIYQVYTWRRKVEWMSDEDLKRLDAQDWQKQVRFRSYTRLINRSICALIFLYFLVVPIAITGNISALPIISGVFSLCFIISAVLGFRYDRRLVNETRKSEGE